jgi:hypothetical protein
VGDEPNLTPPDAGGDGTATPPPPPPPGGKANGAPCAAGGECSSGQCADGVCCDSACNGVCEKCNLPGKVGQCEPIPDGEDPDNECPTIPLPAPEAGAPPDASDAATDAGDAASDAVATPDAPIDAGTPINLPEGGINPDDTKCAGKCNGKRACAYPDSTKTCGDTFCNTPSTQGRGACDGQGHCVLRVESCSAYSCPTGEDGGMPSTACRTSCTAESDCLPTHYCDNGTCKPKLANGTACQSVAQCQSGHCVSNVCCNDECNVTGGSCTSTGNVGRCVCPACPGGTCKLWYRDRDGDGYGDMNATVQNGDAIPGCVNNPADGGPPAPPQAGFVENNTDCYDVNDTRGRYVHPGQTAYFDIGYGPNNSFDYDCSGTIEKETPEFPGGSCGVCQKPIFGCNKGSCTAVGQQGSFDCNEYGICGTRVCFGCFTGATSGFLSSVACGQAAYRYYCGTCASSSGSPPMTSSSTPEKQRCH